VTATGSLGAEDELAYRWEQVAVPPGGTAAYLSYEIQQGVASGDGAAEDYAARGKALAYAANPLAHVYAGMTDDEIAAVRNWPHPAPTPALAVGEATDRAPVAFDATGSAPSPVPGACSALSYAWDLDGVGRARAVVQAGVPRTVGLKVRRTGRVALTVTVTDIAGNARTLTKRV
jgi:hypothetical protein